MVTMTAVTRAENPEMASQSLSFPKDNGPRPFDHASWWLWWACATLEQSETCCCYCYCCYCCWLFYVSTNQPTVAPFWLDLVQCDKAPLLLLLLLVRFRFQCLSSSLPRRSIGTSPHKGRRPHSLGTEPDRRRIQRTTRRKESLDPGARPSDRSRRGVAGRVASHGAAHKIQ